MAVSTSTTPGPRRTTARTRLLAGSGEHSDQTVGAGPLRVVRLRPTKALRLPSPYEIGLQQQAHRHMMNEANEAELALRQAGRSTPATERMAAEKSARRISELASDREYTFRDLLPTVPASTAADAGVQLCYGLEVIADIENNHLTPFQLTLNHRRLRRILASAIGVIRLLAEQPLEDAVDSWALDAAAAEFAPAAAAGMPEAGRATP